MSTIYYNNWAFQLSQFEVLNKDIDNSTVYKVSFNEKLNCFIGERTLKNTIDRVYYYNTHLENVAEYHSVNYEDKDIFIVKKMSDFVFLLLSYDKLEFTGSQLFEFNQEFKETKNSIYNRNYELQQYSETFYENGVEIEEKVFIPSIWKIHSEQLK
jgi:hypothetical protein